MKTHAGGKAHGHGKRLLAGGGRGRKPRLTEALKMIRVFRRRFRVNHNSPAKGRSGVQRGLPERSVRPGKGRGCWRLCWEEIRMVIRVRVRLGEDYIGR